MWESRFLRFPRVVGKEGNLPLVFLFFHCPSFPQPCFAVFVMRSVSARSWQTTSVFLSASFSRSPCRSPSRFLVHLFLGQLRLDIPRQVGQLPQNVPRCRMPPIDSFLLALGPRHHFRHPA